MKKYYIKSKNMRLILVLIAFAVSSIFMACKSKTETSSNIVGTDSALYNNNMLADTARAQTLPPGTKRVVETFNADGSGTKTTTTVPGVKTSSSIKTGTVKTGTSVSSEAGTSSTKTETKTVQKKGWSNKAKGAVIGGVGGAVVGAAVSKKKGKGAIIGGVVGAAGGYIIGNEKDKKQKR